MTRKLSTTTTTITTITCDVCGSECQELDSTINIQIDDGDGRNVGPSFVSGRMFVFMPHGVDHGDICRPCLMKWLKVYVKGKQYESKIS